MKRLRILFILAVTALGVLAAGAGPDAGPAESAFPGANGKIAFQSNRDDPNHEIYSMNPDGSGVARLTNISAADQRPSWSADGNKIAFDSNRDGNFEVYVMNADGSGQRNLTRHPGHDSAPAW